MKLSLTMLGIGVLLFSQQAIAQLKLYTPPSQITTVYYTPPTQDPYAYPYTLVSPVPVMTQENSSLSDPTTTEQSTSYWSTLTQWIPCIPNPDTWSTSKRKKYV